MAGKNIESLYSSLFSMRSTLEDMVQEAQGVINSANAFGGEINRVIGEQMKKYFIPTIQKMIDDTNTPGSLKGVITFLDSVPLAMTRVEPQAEQVSPAIPDTTITEPVGTSASKVSTSDEPSLGASFAHPEGEAQTPVVESKKTSDKKITEKVEKFQVVRSSNKASSLGDISNLKDSVVCEMDCKEDADKKAAELNETVQPEEKETFGTEYKVVKKVIEKEVKKAPVLKESIRGNTTQFISNVEELVDSYIADYDYDNMTPWEGLEADIMDRVKYDRYHSIPSAIKSWVMDGNMAIYNDDIKKDLAKLYDNTPEEFAKWSKYPSDKALDRYCNIMAMYIPKAFKKHEGRAFGDIN